MNTIILWLMILFAYIALSSNISIYNLGFGILVATTIMLLIPVNRKLVNIKHLPKALWSLIVYLIVLARDMMKGGFQVAYIVLQPRMPLKSGVIAVNPDCDHELGQALSAHAITLSPGEMLVDTDQDGTMYIHTLDVEKAAVTIHKEQDYRRRLIDQIFT